MDAFMQYMDGLHHRPDQPKQGYRWCTGDPRLVRVKELDSLTWDILRTCSRAYVTIGELCCVLDEAKKRAIEKTIVK